MMLKLYSIFDSKVKAFQWPNVIVNDDTALRSFKSLVNDGQSMQFKHPTDFILYEIGEYDDSTAEIIPTNPIRLVATALSQVENKIEVRDWKFKPEENHSEKKATEVA